MGRSYFSFIFHFLFYCSALPASCAFNLSTISCSHPSTPCLSNRDSAHIFHHIHVLPDIHTSHPLRFLYAHPTPLSSRYPTPARPRPSQTLRSSGLPLSLSHGHARTPPTPTPTSTPVHTLFPQKHTHIHTHKGHILMTPFVSRRKKRRKRR